MVQQYGRLLGSLIAMGVLFSILLACNPTLSGTAASVVPPELAFSGNAQEVRISNPPFGGALYGYLVYWVIPVSWYNYGAGQVIEQGTFDSNDAYYANQGMIMHSTRNQHLIVFDKSRNDLLFTFADATLVQLNKPTISYRRPNNPINRHYYGAWSISDGEITIYNANAAITPAPTLGIGDSYYLLWSLVIETNQGGEYIIHLNSKYIEFFRYQVQAFS